ncbi:MAG: MFS transporter [Clostridia bacterium]|nr:MFS transporter [Clostridia bacterium]
MLSLLLAIIYISFISLGLPDSLLGSAWPSMYGGLNVPLSYAGIVSVLIAVGTIVSSLFSVKVIRKFGTGKVTAISVLMTALALFGFSISHSFIALCIWTIPYGLGAGAVDTALNNFVALHYKARHMSWLHCFWGVGASIGPNIMGYYLTGNLGWNSGFRAVGLIQAALTAILFISLPLWKNTALSKGEEHKAVKSLKLKELPLIKGARPAMLAFLLYCGLESTTGLWGSTYMVAAKGLSSDAAAKWISMFYLGITGGRFLSGFITMKLSSRSMIRLGQAIALVGTVVLLLPLPTYSIYIGFVLIGLGCAPIYPSLMHTTPENFGREQSQAMMGIQTACAYLGATLAPPLAGLLVERVSVKLYPLLLLTMVVLMIVAVERLYGGKRNFEA